MGTGDHRFLVTTCGCSPNTLSSAQNIFIDAYMVTAGCPDRCTPAEGAEKVALFAVDAVALVDDFQAPDGTKLFIRVGINSGPAVAGVVGTKRPHFTVFGDTVNAASRMESTSMKMKIQCSESTYRLLLEAPKHTFDLKHRGEIDVKGKGTMRTWWIEGSCPGRSSPEGSDLVRGSNATNATSLASVEEQI
jgi:class 3 adenylate cyclase